MNNIAGIQKKLIEKNLDAILITDEKNQRYATGFAFTDGFVLVTREKAWLLTDSRYIEAAGNTVDGCITVQMFDREHSRLSLAIAALQEAGVSRLGAEERKLNHGGHPVLRWNMDNAFVRTDPAGNLKIDKEKSTEKVDGAVALVMALDRAMKNQGGESVYDTRGLLII